MSHPIPLREFFEQHAKAKKEEFLSTFSHPFLLFEEEESLGTTSSGEDLEVTRSLSIVGNHVLAFTPVDPEKSLVYPLTSRKHPFSVTLGRDYSCDVVLTFSDISSRHAQIFWSEERNSYCISDLESRNGTYLNSQIVLAGDVHPLRDQDVLRLAGHMFIFYLPETLFLYLSSSYW